MPEQRPRKTRRRLGPPPFAFTFRCPADLIGPLDEAKWILREQSRTALVAKAIREYLATRGIPLQAA